MDVDELRNTMRLYRALARIHADGRFPPPRHSAGCSVRSPAVTMEWVLRGEPEQAMWPRVQAILQLSAYGLREVIRQDVPRYEPPPADGRCAAPMIRRDGPCGQRSTVVSFAVTNPADGTFEIRSYCRRNAPPQVGPAA